MVESRDKEVKMERRYSNLLNCFIATLTDSYWDIPAEVDPGTLVPV